MYRLWPFMAIHTCEMFGINFHFVSWPSCHPPGASKSANWKTASTTIARELTGRATGKIKGTTQRGGNEIHKAKAFSMEARWSYSISLCGTLILSKANEIDLMSENLYSELSLGRAISDKSHDKFQLSTVRKLFEAFERNFHYVRRGR